MRSSKSDILERFLKDAITNDHVDLVRNAISLDGFSTPPSTDPYCITSAVENRSYNTLKLLLENDFSVSNVNLVSGVANAFNYCDSDLSAYISLLEKIGKETLTLNTIAILEKEKSSASNNRVYKNPISRLTLSRFDDNENRRRLALFLSYIDTKQISNEHLTLIFSHKEIYSGEHCLELIKRFDNEDQLQSFSSEQRQHLFTSLSKSHSIDAVSYCFKRGIILPSDIDNAEILSTTSFYLIAELYANGQDLSSLIQKSLTCSSAEFYLKNFLEDFAKKLEDKEHSFDHPAINLYCDILSGKTFVSSNDNNIKNNLFSALTSLPYVNLICAMLDKIMKDGAQTGKFFMELSHIYNLSKTFSRFSVAEASVLLDMLCESKEYGDFLRRLNSEAQNSKQSDYNYLQNDTVYFALSSQEKEMPFTEKMLSKVPPSKKMCRGIIYRVTNMDLSKERNYEIAKRTLVLIAPYIGSDEIAHHFKTVYWTEPTNFSMTKEFSSLERTKCNYKKIDRLKAIAFAPERYFLDFLNKSKNSKNMTERVKLALSLRSVDPSELLFNEDTSVEAKNSITEVIVTL